MIPIERIVKLERAVAKLLARSFIYYAKGTYTPTYFGATTAGVTTYTTQQGEYTRIGRVVIAQAEIVWTNATGTGVIRLGGLPYTSATGMKFAFAQQISSVTFANGSVEGLLQGAQVVAQLFSPASNVATTELAIEVAGTIRYVVVYFV